MKKVKTIYLSLGSNLGNPFKNLQKAINFLSDKVGNVIKISSVYKTQSWGFESEDFLNCCAELKTSLAPDVLLQKILLVEKILGRTRNNNENYQARTIDIDILFFDTEIISLPNLIIPHPKMLQRKFVMVPLAEIAPTLIHTVLKQKIEQCLKNCEDSLKIKKLDQQLIKPIYLTEKYNYIAIEGNIGVGKSTLAKMISDDFNAKIVLEKFAENPFLPKFYQNKERYAFSVEMNFLVDRHMQLSKDLTEPKLLKNLIISDYYIFKSLIFAQITLQQDEFLLYKKIFDLMYQKIRKPDLYIYLYQDTKRLLENIKKRGRAYEKDINYGYLEKINTSYTNFIKSEKNLNVLMIDISKYDFVNNEADYATIINLISQNKD